MGCAEIISFDAVRAGKQRDTLRQQLHTQFDQWFDALEARLQKPDPTLADVTETIWALRQQRTGGLTETIIHHTYQSEQSCQHARYPTCKHLLKAHPPVHRSVERWWVQSSLNVLTSIVSSVAVDSTRWTMSWRGAKAHAG